MTTPKQPKLTPSAAVALADAGALIRRRLAAWPDTFSPDELAALLGGGRRTPDCQRWKARIVAAPDLGQLAPGCPPVARDALPLPPPDLAPEWLGIDGEIARARAAARASAVRTAAPISRAAAAAWLRAIGETPPAVVVAWLGDTWTNAAKTKADKTPAPWIAEARRIGEKWVEDHKHIHGKPPSSVKAISKHCEDELARREIRSGRDGKGGYLRADYIARWALTGILGRPRGHNWRRTHR